MIWLALVEALLCLAGWVLALKWLDERDAAEKELAKLWRFREAYEREKAKRQR